jgi:phage terminase large subunit-like protein
MFNKADFYYCAIDLSSVTDLTAVSFLCEYKGLYYSHTAFFLPEESIQIHKLFIEIESWKAKDELIITPGNVVDYDYILKYILDFNKKYKARCRKIYYDRYNSTQFAISCTNEGLPIEPCSQTLGTFNSGTRGIEKFILEKKLFLSQNSLMLFNFRCVQLKYDHNNNCKPFKDEKNRYTKKIDGVITLIMSLLAYNSVVNYSYEIV